MIWPHATKQRLCLVCGKDDYCTFGDKAMLCQRTPSDKPHANGGWFHFYDDLKGIGHKPDFVPKAKPAPPQINAGKLMREWRAKTQVFQFRLLADKLNVIPDALVALGAAWAPEYKAWAFPMKDGHGEPIGIRLRNEDGLKWAVTGSRQGIFLPEPSVRVTQPVLLPEGPTDTAAGLTLGLYTIGRPNAKGGLEHLKVALKRLQLFRAVIVADNDELKQLGDRFGYPGIEAAVELKKNLGAMSVIWQPTGPVKDLRQFANKGGTKVLIESQIKERVWSRK